MALQLKYEYPDFLIKMGGGRYNGYKFHLLDPWGKQYAQSNNIEDFEPLIQQFRDNDAALSSEEVQVRQKRINSIIAYNNSPARFDYGNYGKRH